MHGARTEYARTHWRRLLAGGGALGETCSHQRQMTKLGHIWAVVEGAQARLSSPYKERRHHFYVTSSLPLQPPPSTWTSCILIVSTNGLAQVVKVLMVKRPWPWQLSHLCEFDDCLCSAVDWCQRLPCERKPRGSVGGQELLSQCYTHTGVLNHWLKSRKIWMFLYVQGGLPGSPQGRACGPVCSQQAM